jgi:hypothetical protein
VREGERESVSFLNMASMVFFLIKLCRLVKRAVSFLHSSTLKYLDKNFYYYSKRTIGKKPIEMTLFSEFEFYGENIAQSWSD